MVTHTSIVELLSLTIYQFYRIYAAIARVVNKQHQK